MSFKVYNRVTGEAALTERKLEAPDIRILPTREGVKVRFEHSTLKLSKSDARWLSMALKKAIVKN